MMGMVYQETVTVSPPRPLSSDRLDDLIEIVIDELDSAAGDSSVSTYALDNGDVEFTVTVDAEDDYAGRAAAAVVIRDAFKAAGVVLVADAPSLLTA
jgi:hypothetical protein